MSGMETSSALPSPLVVGNGNVWKEATTTTTSEKQEDPVGEGYVKRVGLNSPDLKPSNSGEKKCPGMSLLAGKFLLFPDGVRGVRRQQGAEPRVEMACVNIATREQFTCKVIPRNPKGLAMLAAYHRLEESPEFVNQVVEAILTPKIVYLIMPRHYGNVHTYLLEKRTLEEPEAANIFKQMVEAVQHCHSKGIILRDIKMGRFVFMDKEKTKVRLESLEDATLLMDPSNDNLNDKHGCPNYVSPEKAETLKTNLRYPGKASDVWCLGVILYTMLSGRYPFNDPNQSKLLNKIRAGNFVIPPGLSSSVSFLIKSLLRKSPSERPKCVEILRSPWITKHCRSIPFNISVDIEPETKADDSVDVSMSTQDPSTAQRKITVCDQVVPNF